MDLEELMARAKVRAQFSTRRKQRLHMLEEQQALRRQQKRPQSDSSSTAAAILKFAAVPCKVSTQGTQVQLPDSVLDIVMSKLASCLEPGGVYGPALVARDLANASLVCSEFYASAKVGFSALNSLIQQQLQQRLHKQPLPPPPSAYLGEKARQQHHAAVALSAGINLPGPKGWDFWERVITDPLSLQLEELETAARQMGIIELAPAAAVAAAGAAAVQHPPAGDLAGARAAEAAEDYPAAAAAAAAGPSGGASPVSSSASSPSSTTGNRKYKVRTIARLLACFGLTQPLRVTMPAAAAGAAASQEAAEAGPTAPPLAAAAAGTGAATANPTADIACSDRAAVLRALILERSCPIIAWDGPDGCAGLVSAVRELSGLHVRTVAKAQSNNGRRGCLAKIRSELAAAGITGMEQLTQLLRQERAAAAAERQRQQQERQQAKQQSKRAAAAAQAPPAKKGRKFSLSSVSIRPKEKDFRYI